MPAQAEIERIQALLEEEKKPQGIGVGREVAKMLHHTEVRSHGDLPKIKPKRRRRKFQKRFQVQEVEKGEGKSAVKERPIKVFHYPFQTHRF